MGSGITTTGVPTLYTKERVNRPDVRVLVGVYVGMIGRAKGGRSINRDIPRMSVWVLVIGALSVYLKRKYRR